jgi:AcrR family transcriptional regulator
MARKLSPEKRERLLQSGLQLFVANGVQNTSTNAIAKQAGMAAGTFFLYFPTKVDLIHELVLKIGREQSEYIQSILSPALSVEETFATIWEGSLHWFLQNMQAYQYFRQVRDSGLIAEEVVEESQQYFAYYYQAIQRGLQERRIKPYPVELIGNLLYHGIAAVMNLILANPEPARQKEYAQSGFQIFWDGVKSDTAIQTQP